MKFYLQVQSDGTITDAITYQHGNYVEYEAEILPIGINGGWFKLENGVIVEYPNLKPMTTEDEIVQLKYKLMTEDEKYKALDKTSISLVEIKAAKLSQLEELCEKSIVNGFDYTINNISYKFSCSINAQANFQGTDTLFKDGLIPDGLAEWTVTNNTTGDIERIFLDQITFNQIKLQVFVHINSNISKLRNILQPQLEACTTNIDVEAVVW